MNVTLQKCDSYATLEDAQDAMAGLIHIPGYVVGYIDQKENRPMIFVKTTPGGELSRGQRHVELFFPPQSDSPAT